MINHIFLSEIKRMPCGNIFGVQRCSVGDLINIFAKFSDKMFMQLRVYYCYMAPH